MKISASVYSSASSKLPQLINELDEHGIDYFHIDCNDDPLVFNDIKEIRKYSSKPVDLHLITPTPERYYSMIAECGVEYVTFQFEELKRRIDIPTTLSAHLGLAITSETEIKVFDDYSDRFSFVLIMATTPGMSGGVFNKENFKKIREFRKKYPTKQIHVDGGVNAEVSFILRNMGVNAAVVGSYLFKSVPLGKALMNLKMHETNSHYQVRDFMHDTNDIPLVHPNERNIEQVLRSIEEKNMGFTILVDTEGKLDGIISNADIRKGLLKNIKDLNKIDVDTIINRDPVMIAENQTVLEMLKLIKSKQFPISYIPVVNHENVITGCVTFVNLIKGEL